MAVAGGDRLAGDRELHAAAETASFVGIAHGFAPLRRCALVGAAMTV
jgi:hypothetical protein